jgi:hypothetical protein
MEPVRGCMQPAASRQSKLLRWARASGGCILLLALATSAPSRGMMMIDEEFIGGEEAFDPNAYRNDTNLPQAIQQALSMERLPGMNDWGWRNAVEDRLVNLGARALPLLRIQTEQRQGYELDALQVAIFRLENAPLDPQAVIEPFAAREFGGSGAGRVTRVFGGTGAAGLCELLPHHLFYSIQSRGAPPRRLVVALAADSKIQPLMDDAALSKFLRTELEPAHSEAAMEFVGTAVARLAAARIVSFYRPDELHTEVVGRTAQATLKVALHTTIAKVAFDAGGRVGAITCTFTGGPQPLPTPLTVPEVLPSPPPMPG